MPRSRFCPTCGQALPQAALPFSAAPLLDVSDPPVEGVLTNGKRFHVSSDALDLRELLHVVESSVQWWQRGLTSSNAVTR
ncbi:MAG: protein phosphatase, partial [Roseiflexus castenholzii]